MISSIQKKGDIYVVLSGTATAKIGILEFDDMLDITEVIYEEKEGSKMDTYGT